MISRIALTLTIAALAVTATAADIEWRSCGDLAPADSAAAIDCGWLTTGDRLGGHAVRLRLAVLRARPDRADAEPVVYVPGGPGAGAGLDTASLKRWRHWQQRAAWPHDIVLFDPRGTGESRPRPDCAPGADRNADVTTIEEPGDFVDAARAARRCYHNLGAARAAQLGPAAQLRDLQALLDGLGVARANFWGLSYGTRIVRLFAARHPERVRAMVLDSLFDFERDNLLAIPAQVGGAISRLDADCAARADCMARGRPPSAIVHDLLARYAAQPPTVTADGEGAPRRFVVTPYRLLLMALFADQTGGRTADTIAALTRADVGDTAALAPLAERLRRLASDARRNEAVYWSTRCAFGEDLPDESAWRRALSAYPAIARYLEPARASAVCAFWRVPPVSTPAADAALGAPTLVLAGDADVRTPAAWAQAFVERHPRAQLLRVPAAGHGVAFTSACALRAMRRFWAQPRSPTLPTCD